VPRSHRGRRFRGAPRLPARLGVGGGRIAVYGGSAGGGLATPVALLARDLGRVKLCLQCLLYSMLDDRTAVASDGNPFAGESVWTRADAMATASEPGRRAAEALS
jgi:acetyl esterase/lipase